MKIASVTFKTSKLGEIETFYGGLLGLPVIAHPEGLKIQIGSSELVFEPVAATDPFYHFAITIPSNQIEHARRWIKEKRIQLMPIPESGAEIADFTNWNARSIYFYDPAGNIVELIARFDLHNDIAATY